jgi:hypothetical protein
MQGQESGDLHDRGGRFGWFDFAGQHFMPFSGMVAASAFRIAVDGIIGHVKLKDKTRGSLDAQPGRVDRAHLGRTVTFANRVAISADGN